jgi:hypothetical protein
MDLCAVAFNYVSVSLISSIVNRCSYWVLASSAYRQPIPSQPTSRHHVCCGGRLTCCSDMVRHPSAKPSVLTSSTPASLNRLQQFGLLPEVAYHQICQPPDLSAAFHTVDHEILLDRLHVSFGIGGTVHDWFRSYLTDRVECAWFVAIIANCRPVRSAPGLCCGPSAIHSVYRRPDHYHRGSGLSPSSLCR